MIAADAVVCPFVVGPFETKPLGALYGYLSWVITSAINPRLRMLGLVPSRVNVGSAEEMGALESLRNHPQVGPKILPIVLGGRAAVKQSIARGKSVWRGVGGMGTRQLPLNGYPRQAPS